MKKLRLWMMALAVCAICAGCSSAETETVATEAAVTETVLETMAETQPPETTEETTPVLEEPVGEYYQCLNFDGWYQDDTMPVEIFECRMYPTENGVTIFAVDYKTVADLQLIVYAFADDGDEKPDFWYVVEDLTTDEETTLVFEMDNELLDEIYQPGMLFRDQYGFEVGGADIFHCEPMFNVTDGNPVGEAEELLFEKNGNVTVYSATMQHLDNGFVRFTLDCKPQKDRYISFYNPPEADRVMYLQYVPTSGERETIIVDVWAEEVSGLQNMNFNFFNGDAPVARVYLQSPITDFEELDASGFAGFIGGDGQFMILYYGVIDEAVLGATLTAEDGSCVVVTEDILSKNGDGYSLLMFKECKVKRDDTVCVTLSKDGYEDLSLELYVY